VTSPPYVPLWVKSNHSFLQGASHPEELVTEAHRLGLPGIGLTDVDGVHGVVRAHVKARELGVHLVIGSEVTVGDDTLVLLAQDRAGYANLCGLLSRGRLRCPKGQSCVTWDEVAAHAEGVLALWSGVGMRRDVREGRPAVRAEPKMLDWRQVVDVPRPHDPWGVLRDAFGDRLYALALRHLLPGDAGRERALRADARRVGAKVVAGTEILYHVAARRELHDVVTCIRHGVTLATCGTLIRANAEHTLLAPYTFAERWRDDPDALDRTREVAARCTFSMDEIRYVYPSEHLPDGTTTAGWLEQLTMEGAADRYPDGVPRDVHAQIRRELDLIHELEFDGYFLTMWEIVRFCRREGILCQGRGSAANSAVCYALGITAVDPVRMGLLFERFLSKERGEPPDIDLDIAHDRREEAIQFVYEKYGRSHAAMVANVIRYRARSAVREVGKALGFPETSVDRLARLLNYFDAPSPEVMRDAGFDPENAAHQHLARLTHEIQDFPRHLSIHPGGFLLGHEPVSTLVPIENATMADRTVIQWDKDDLEALGLFKVDLLGLGMLSVVDRSLQLLREHEGRELSMATIPARDEPTYEMIRAADTVGVFQIESRAQMAMLPRLRPRNYYDLVIEVSIVRPGPITGGMVHPYLRRRNGEEAVTYPHPSLEPVLAKTLGVPIFQEQVMKLAVVAADYSPGEADQLRRDMAAWKQSGRIERHRERMISRMMHNGIDREFAERVFEQIRGFGEYGFPESHAASFALIAYASAWLKRHHPAAFLCALLNSQPMGFYAPPTLIEDARRHDVDVRPVDVTASEVDCTLEPIGGGGFGVRVGLAYVKGLATDRAGAIVAARAERPFAGIDDLVARTRLDRGSLTRLAEAGALDPFDPDRRHAFWEVLGRQASAEPELATELREDPVTLDPLTELETIGWDYVATGHSARGHPLVPLRESLRAKGLPEASELGRFRDGRRVRYVGVVICRQRPGTAKGVVFMTLEDETGFVNLVFWEKVFAKHRLLAKTLSLMGVTGKLQIADGVVHLVVDDVWVPKLAERPADRASRDFH